MYNHLLKLVFLTLFGATTIASATDSWWNKSWTSRRKITLDAATVQGMSADSTAPLLLRLSDANFGFTAKEDGSDIRIVSGDDKTLLPFYLERYDAFLNNHAYIWISAGAIPKGSKTDFYLYYGNPTAEAVSVSDPKAAVEADLLVNYHFAEEGMAVDSTTNGLTATTLGSWVEGSFIGGGHRFDASTQIALPENPALSIPANSPLTWSCWVKLGGAEGAVMSYGPATNGVLVSVDASGLPTLSVAGQATPAAQPIPVNTWAHLAIVAESGKTTLYVDGKSAAAAAVGWPAVDKGIFSLGKSVDRAGFVGELDEMQLAKVAKDPSWVAFSAFTQSGNNQDKSISFAAEEIGNIAWIDSKTKSAILVKNLTLDGWIVIVLCFFMSIISWVIMIRKIKMLSRLSKANQGFMERWKKLSRNLHVLDGSDAESIQTMGGMLSPGELKQLRESNVYRLYNVGADELSHRLKADGGVDAGVSARSMEAIKATMDSGLIREGQRLNSLVVLLTICISGGPFLGLLGTVIGVMVTFAAIALEGAVDVNNIAPGIAGALLATIAGLAVAIPALFGYNYIVSKIKEATADMSVFIDEFVTRMAENYPDAH